MILPEESTAAHPQTPLVWFGVVVAIKLKFPFNFFGRQSESFERLVCKEQRPPFYSGKLDWRFSDGRFKGLLRLHYYIEKVCYAYFQENSFNKIVFRYSPSFQS